MCTFTPHLLLFFCLCAHSEISSPHFLFIFHLLPHLLNYWKPTLFSSLTMVVICFQGYFVLNSSKDIIAETRDSHLFIFPLVDIPYHTFLSHQNFSQVTAAPIGAQAAMLDVEGMYYTIPVKPDHK